jgi:hypothetical protein
MISAANSRWRGCQRILRKGSPITSTLHPQERKEGVTRVSAGKPKLAAPVGAAFSRPCGLYPVFYPRTDIECTLAGDVMQNEHRTVHRRP